MGTSTGSVTSPDGTTIGYRRIGERGSAVVLLHGAGQSSGNLTRLAQALSCRFTVYVPDRRGRGLSGPIRDGHGLQTEVEDLCALLDASGAARVFGLSAGAVIAIETALVRPDIRRLALYEPPLSFNGVQHAGWVPRYEQHLEAGRPGAALITVLKGTGDRTSVLRFLPSALLALPLDAVIRHTADRVMPDGAVSPRELISTIRYDARTVMQAEGKLERFSVLTCEVLLMGGTRSNRPLTATLDGLSRVLPNARRVVLPRVGHTAADNSGRPFLVARPLLAFLLPRVPAG